MSTKLFQVAAFIVEGVGEFIGMIAGKGIRLRDGGDFVIVEATNDGSGLKSISLPVTFADLAVADTFKYLNFADMLPAGAIFMATKVVETVPFENAGNTTLIELDVGTGNGNPDRFGLFQPLTDAPGTYWGAIGALPKSPFLLTEAVQPACGFFSYSDPVNLDTLVQGECTVTLYYLEAT